MCDGMLKNLESTMYAVNVNRLMGVTVLLGVQQVQITLLGLRAYPEWIGRPLETLLSGCAGEVTMYFVKKFRI